MAADNIGNIVWLGNLQPGNTLDVITWNKDGPSRSKGPFFDYTGGGEYFAGEIFRCGKFRTSNVCEISRSIFRPLCEINPVRNLATGAHFHYLFVLSLLSFSVWEEDGGGP